MFLFYLVPYCTNQSPYSSRFFLNNDAYRTVLIKDKKDKMELVRKDPVSLNLGSL
jgi:hypothetical protein